MLKNHKIDCQCFCCKNIRGEGKQSIETCLKKSKSLQGRVPGMLGKHRSLESRQMMSKIMTGKHWKCSQEARLHIGTANKGKFGNEHPKFGISPGHRKKIQFEVPNQGKVWLRSTWELTVAKYLVDKKVDFRYEYRRFILDAKTFLPDFYLVTEDKYLEVKGWVNDLALQKMKEMKIFYPEVNIEMITKKEMVRYN